MNASLAANNGGMCTVCYTDFADAKNDKMATPIAMACGHQFCKQCWKDYLKEKVNCDS